MEESSWLSKHVCISSGSFVIQIFKKRLLKRGVVAWFSSFGFQIWFPCLLGKRYWQWVCARTCVCVCVRMYVCVCVFVCYHYGVVRCCKSAQHIPLLTQAMIGPKPWLNPSGSLRESGDTSKKNSQCCSYDTIKMSLRSRKLMGN